MTVTVRDAAVTAAPAWRLAGISSKEVRLGGQQDPLATGTHRSFSARRRGRGAVGAAAFRRADKREL